MSAPLAPIALYARLVDASAMLHRAIQRLDDEDADTARIEAVWVHLDDLIEQLPAALAADAQRQEED
jgi:hypothetical protein